MLYYGQRSYALTLEYQFQGLMEYRHFVYFSKEGERKQKMYPVWTPGGVLRERVMNLSGIAVPFKYNKLLAQALEDKVIERHDKNRLTYYGAAPF